MCQRRYRKKEVGRRIPVIDRRWQARRDDGDCVEAAGLSKSDFLLAPSFFLLCQNALSL
jgi:hypothetical protein